MPTWILLLLSCAAGTSLTLSDLPEGWEGLTKLRQLRSLTVEHCTNPGGMVELQKRLPECSMQWSLGVGGEWFDVNTADLRLTLPDVNSDELMAQGYRLKIFDAYRPQSAVDHFVRWSRNAEDTLMKRFFYPNVDKRSVFRLGYLASRSNHSRGSALDLTLFDMTTEKEVDMGGTYDWFGPESHADFGGNPYTMKYRKNDAVTEEQFKNRMLLRSAMMRHGFKPIQEEWWHFTLVNEPYPDTYFSHPVK